MSDHNLRPGDIVDHRSYNTFRGGVVTKVDDTVALVHWPFSREGSWAPHLVEALRPAPTTPGGDGHA